MPAFVMKGELERRERLKCHSDIHLRPTNHTQVRKFGISELTTSISFKQHFLTGGLVPREVRAFIESVENDINWGLPR